MGRSFQGCAIWLQMTYCQEDRGLQDGRCQSLKLSDQGPLDGKEPPERAEHWSLCPVQKRSRHGGILDISITTVTETLHTAFFIEKCGGGAALEAWPSPIKITYPSPGRDVLKLREQKTTSRGHFHAHDREQLRVCPRSKSTTVAQHRLSWFFLFQMK